MDLFDRLALEARRYDQQTVPRSGSRVFSIVDVLEMFGRNAILELTAQAGSTAPKTVKPDPVRKIKVSLLDDGFSLIHSGASDHYEVFRTAPSGDLSKVRIVAFAPDGARIGELRLLVGRRSYDHYFAEDPIIETLRRREEAGGSS
jgi:hypothetical protein